MTSELFMAFLLKLSPYHGLADGILCLTTRQISGMEAPTIAMRLQGNLKGLPET